MVVRISDKTQNYSKVTKLLVKPNCISCLYLNIYNDQLEKSIVIEIYDHYLKKLNLEEIDNSEYNIIQSIKRWSK